MGSLMAGWNSVVLENPDAVKIERNRSLTNEEIDNFWKTHRKVEVEFEEPTGEEDPKIKSPHSPSFILSPQRRSGHWKTGEEEGKKMPPMSSNSPSAGKRDYKLGDWWMRSNWAFLNESNEESKKTSKYTAQFNVANLATSTSI